VLGARQAIMVVYNKGVFIDEEPDRRSVRDEAREKFFSEIGGERLKDPFEFDPDPAAQLKVVEGLIDTALGLHNDEKSALQAMKSQVSALALSVPGVGVSTSGRPTKNQVLLSARGEFFHLKNY
jgi:hypothetical protein